MLRKDKKQIIDRLTEDLSQSEVIIATGYQGLTAEQMGELRQTLIKAGAEYHVVKNTLVCLAANKAGREQIADMIDGPVALAFGYSDIISLAKALNQYLKSTELPLKIKGGLLGEQVLTPEDVISLANLPSKEILLSQLIGWLQVPMVGLRDILNAPLQGLIAVLQTRKDDLMNNK